MSATWENGLQEPKTRAGAEAYVRSKGWEHGGDGDGFWFEQAYWGHWKAAASWGGRHPDHPIFDSLAELMPHVLENDLDNPDLDRALSELVESDRSKEPAEPDF